MQVVSFGGEGMLSCLFSDGSDLIESFSFKVNVLVFWVIFHIGAIYEMMSQY